MAIHGVAFPADYIQMGPGQRRDHRMPEAQAVGRLLAFQPGKDASRRIASLALRLAQRVLATPPGPLSAESFLRHYGLSTREGVALMCVAEALLRIPDAQTADALLRDKLSSGSWGSTKDDASFVSSAADWALMLTGALARWREAPQEDLSSSLKQLVARLGEPVARAAIRQAMRILAEQFVLAETIEEAVSRASERRPYSFSFDALGRSRKRRIPMRLVKGAYWDGEIKRAQQLGMPDYPVFTRKAVTDISYVACATKLLAAPDAIYPAFATHNCRTVATILELRPPDKGGKGGVEFQKLLGMGDALYEALLAEHPDIAVRVYAPVGSFTDLLPYLVRRLLENGANTSFVHQIADPDVPLEDLVADPIEQLPEPYVPDPRIPLPRDIYPDRKNSLGLDLARRDVLDSLYQRIAAEKLSPAPPSIALDSAIGRAAQSFESWSRVPAAGRAAVLERAADLLEERMLDLVALIVREGGRTYADAVSEVREAADFCRYYALQSRKHCGQSHLLPGPAGERNELQLHGRGVFACISPWNFPLSIFTGQVAAALAAGNTVIAKPAEQTPRIGFSAIDLLHQAGVPVDAVICVAGDGEAVGAPLVADPRIAGVAFTGSVETAKRIDLALAQRGGPIVPLIAETGGDNAMIVDSSALPEQVVDDVVISAFQSAGQRCSAQRILFVDAGCAPRVLQLLAGALAELKVGDPAEPDTDVGPIIDPPSRDALLRHIEKLRGSAKLIGEAQLKIEGNYIAPVAFELALDQLPRTEVFGPILHVCLYRRSNLGEVLQWIRDTGYGLTLGIHSRIQSFVDEVVRAARVGNIYVNRSMIGAVVGVQPFGGEGLSGTGPKAGGPHYLPRFATERTLTVNTAAVGGVTELLTRT